MRKVLLFILLTFPPCFCFGQNKESALTERLFQHNHISFTIATNWTQKAKTESTGGPYHLGAQTMRGWEAGVNYHINFRDRSYSLIVGLHGRVIPRNHDVFIPKEDFTPALQEDFAMNRKLTRIMDMHFYVPIVVEKRWYSKNNNHWNLDAGLALGFYPDEIDESWWAGGNGQTPIVDLHVLVSSNFKPWMNYVVAGGHTWKLKNNNLLRANLQVNYTSFNLAKGDYEINVSGKPQSSGTYASRLSGAGLSLSYILTGSRRNLVKQYKKELREKGF